MGNADSSGNQISFRLGGVHDFTYSLYIYKYITEFVNLRTIRINASDLC